MTEIGRNAPCPCGSGLKYKRCCLRREDEVALDALEAERVWGRMQSWALERFGDELYGSLKEHMDARGVGGEERPANDEDLSLALRWLLIDREVVADGTPARLYSKLPELSAGEREMAARIAASRLGVHRVTDVEPGVWIELEKVIGGASTRVVSPHVSREAVLWHVLLCRVMEGGPVMVSETGELELDDVTSLGTFTLHADRLEFFALSEARLDVAVALIDRYLQNIAGPPSRSVQSVQDAMSERRDERAAAGVESRPACEPTPRRGPDALRPEDAFVPPDARIRELTYRRWIDDPNQHLGGLSPREAAIRPEYRRELEVQLRSIEHNSAREHADRRPGPEATWLRTELGVEGERLAA